MSWLVTNYIITIVGICIFNEYKIQQQSIDALLCHSYAITELVISHVNYLFTYAPTVSIKRIPAESDADNALRRHHPFDAYDYAYYS